MSSIIPASAVKSIASDVATKLITAIPKDCFTPQNVESMFKTFFCCSAVVGVAHAASPIVKDIADAIVDVEAIKHGYERTKGDNATLKKVSPVTAG